MKVAQEGVATKYWSERCLQQYTLLHKTLKHPDSIQTWDVTAGRESFLATTPPPELSPGHDKLV